MSTATLTSLAILKVNLDRGGDYLDYLRPFVLQVLADCQEETVSDAGVSRQIQEKFGLVIPPRTVQILLGRLAKIGILEKSYGVYVPCNVADPGLHAKRSAVARTISTTVNAVVRFARETSNLELDEVDATTAICSFLSHFDISCLRAYLRDTAIPDVPKVHGRQLALVGKYVIHVQQESSRLFEDFMTVVQGHMLANALLCPDLTSRATFKGVTFYLDTPLLIHQLGLEGDQKQLAIGELVHLLQKLGGRVAAFAHSREELDHVILGAAEFVDSPRGRGGIVVESRRRGVTRSDLLLLRAAVDDRLAEEGIGVDRTPEYTGEFQIDERAFENILDDEVSHYNDRAKAYDVNSVRSIYALRKGRFSRSIEWSRAILVTSNTAFARAAWQYGKTVEASRDVSSVISDFSLANIAWLKAPMGASSLPMAEVMAYAYAAVQPSVTLMDKFLKEIERLSSNGTVSQRDHELLRSNTLSYDRLMDLTLGDEAALTQESIFQTLERVTAELRGEQGVELSSERAAHERTRTELRESGLEVLRLRDRLYWACQKKANAITGTFLVIVWVFVALGVFSQFAQTAFWLRELLGHQIVDVVSWAHQGIVVVNLTIGVSLSVLYRRVRAWLLRWFLRREGLESRLIKEKGDITARSADAAKVDAEH